MPTLLTTYKENETTNGARHNATFSRIYRDSDGDWQDSTSFGRDDLPLLGKVADQVHSGMFENGKIVAAAQASASGDEAPI